PRAGHAPAARALEPRPARPAHQASGRPQYELIAVGIGDDRRGAPVGLLRLLHERHTLLRELLAGRHHVVGKERDPGEGPDPVLVRIGREELDPGPAPPDAQLDPALVVVEGLVRDHAKAELLGVEVERPLLIRDRHADELDALDHREAPESVWPQYWKSG